MNKRWQPEDQGSRPAAAPGPRATAGPPVRPNPRPRRSGSALSWLRPTRLVIALAAGILVGIVSIPDHYQSGPLAPAVLRAGVDSSLPAPSRLQTTGLNSTIRANWTPTTDSRSAWQLFSVWDGSRLVGEKVLSATAAAADGNGLVPNHAYMVAVQSMSASGQLSDPLTAKASTDRQSAMRNAAFFENFDDSASGPLDPNYFDVRLRDGSTTPENVDGRARVFVSEHHFHTELISGEGDAAVTIRPRGVFDFANRVGTFQFEVDMAGMQSIPGKWFEIHLSRHAPADAQFFGLATNDTYPDDVSFTIFRPVNATDPSHDQEAAISVNAGAFHRTFEGRSNNFTPKNVRVPVVLQVSQTSAEMFINGVSVAKASGFTLPFTQGDWTIAQRAFYAPRSPSFPQYLQLIHWQTVQFDGPAGGFSPVRKTYVAPGCPGAKNAFEFSCVVDAHGSTTLNIPDAISGITSARLQFNPFDDGSCSHGTYTVSALVNGHAVTAAAQPATPAGQGEHCYDNNLAFADVPVSFLKQGANTIKIGRQSDQVELEAAFDKPRVINVPAPQAAAILAVTNDNLLTGRPAGASTVDLTTYLFSQGADVPIPYTVTNRTGTETPWLSIVTPTSGTISSIATGGSLVPITVRIDFSKANKDPGNVIPGILEVTGGVYIAIGYDRGAPTYRYAIRSFTPLITEFNKSAIPDYHGTGGPSPTPTPAPSASPTPSPKPCQP